MLNGNLHFVKGPQKLWGQRGFLSPDPLPVSLLPCPLPLALCIYSDIPHLTLSQKLTQRTQARLICFEYSKDVLVSLKQ